MIHHIHAENNIINSRLIISLTEGKKAVKLKKIQNAERKKKAVNQECYIQKNYFLNRKRFFFKFQAKRKRHQKVFQIHKHKQDD